MNDLQAGKTYLINHDRKGTFMARIQSVNDGWVDAVVTGGKTTSKVGYNVKTSGESIRFKQALVRKITPQPQC